MEAIQLFVYGLGYPGFHCLFVSCLALCLHIRKELARAASVFRVVLLCVFSIGCSLIIVFCWLLVKGCFGVRRLFCGLLEIGGAEMFREVNLNYEKTNISRFNLGSSDLCFCGFSGSISES
jgi:hypothetical protein